MDAEHGLSSARSEIRFKERTPSAINARYAAFLDPNGLVAHDLSVLNHVSHRFHYAFKRSRFLTVLEFSPIQLNLLALGQRETTLIFDLETESLRCFLRGNGRTVTSIAFHPVDFDVIAIGTSDGAISIWSLKEPVEPVHRFRGNGSSCQSIIFDSSDRDVLAFVSKSELYVWHTGSSQAILMAHLEGRRPHWLAWHPDCPQQLTSISKGGSLSVWNLETAVRLAIRARGFESNAGSDDESTLGEFEAAHHLPYYSFDFGFPVHQFEWIGRNGMLVVPSHRNEVLIYSLTLGSRTVEQIWQHGPGYSIDCVGIHVESDDSMIIMCSAAQFSYHEIPSVVLENIGGRVWMKPRFTPENEESRAKKPVANLRATMRPDSVSVARDRRKVSKNKPKQTMKKRSRKDNEAAKPLTSEDASQPRLTPPQSMTSSLELPKAKSDNDSASMPFLSPSIPAQQTSPTTSSALNDSLYLPPLAQTLLDPRASVAHDESDSDDDELAGLVNGSITFLPGGVNVPLPRKSGATFGPNGDILIFMPLKTMVTSAVGSKEVTGSHETTVSGAEISQLFPSFRNLIPGSNFPDHFPEYPTLRSKTTTSSSGFGHNFTFRTSRYDSPNSLGGNFSPTKKDLPLWPIENRIGLRVYSVESLTTMHKEQAEANPFSFKEDESEFDICQRNAQLASSAGIEEAANVWSALAINVARDYYATDVFEDEHTRFAGSSSYNDLLMASPEFSNPNLGVHLEAPYTSSHPFENSWTANKYFAWAEQRADVQMLANMSAAWTRAAETLDRDRTALHRSSTTSRSTSFSYAVQDADSFDVDTARRSSALPVVRADPQEWRKLSESPVKTRLSRTSSRDPSLPNTPHPDSSSSTPPFRFPAISRQSTRLSASGSASPEHHRSSFSAAAKQYAQSITDKFASRGPSPPLKKPEWISEAELSSSLPNTASSWSKSVSFASTTDTARDSQRSMSFTHNDDDSDSDKTIDDSVPTHLRRVSTSQSSIAWHDLSASSIDHRRSPASSRSNPFLTSDMVQKCRIWCRCYAQQLRSWDLLVDAIGLEKLMGIVDTTVDDSKTTSSSSSSSLRRPLHVVPQVEAGHVFSTCGICYCAIQAAQQLCPVCLHTTHPTCLQDLLDSLTTIEEFTCPTGCGCDCTSTGGGWEFDVGGVFNDDID